MNANSISLPPDSLAALVLAQAREHAAVDASPDAFVHIPPLPDTQHDPIDSTPPEADNVSDPGSLEYFAQLKAISNLPYNKSPPLDVEDEPNKVPHTESPFPPNDCAQPDTETAPSCINLIVLSQWFISTLRNASLDKSSMDTESVYSLCHQPKSPLVVNDPNLHLSLDIFLAINYASNETYTLVHNAII